jgi:hypothetical protein
MGYQWQPLDSTRREIRVLDLDAGAEESLLRGCLRHVSMNALRKPQYETVSYAWGERTLVETILIGDKTMSIPASAASALRCMRLPEQNRTLWIDCICIDQDDNLEKGQQVRLMADIYTSSICTLAFIGNDEALGQRAFHGMTSLCNTLGKECLENPAESREEDCKYFMTTSIGQPLEAYCLCHTLGKFRCYSTSASSHVLTLYLC